MGLMLLGVMIGTQRSQTEPSGDPQRESGHKARPIHFCTWHTACHKEGTPYIFGGLNKFELRKSTSPALVHDLNNRLLKK